MGKPAARIGDMHTCPMVTGLVPHVGGPIIGPGAPNVLIGGMPAAVMGDMVTCAGPPDTIIMGSTGVFIGGKPAARMGDPTAHGGIIILGCMTVLIGEVGSGSAPTVMPFQMSATLTQMNPSTSVVADQIMAMKTGAKKGVPFCAKCAAMAKQKSQQ
jgi:uncharacterized Zn-binding protein involved in type VI secretion